MTTSTAGPCTPRRPGHRRRLGPLRGRRLQRLCPERGARARDAGPAGPRHGGLPPSAWPALRRVRTCRLSMRHPVRVGGEVVFVEGVVDGHSAKRLPGGRPCVRDLSPVHASAAAGGVPVGESVTGRPGRSRGVGENGRGRMSNVRQGMSNAQVRSSCALGRWAFSAGQVVLAPEITGGRVVPVQSSPPRIWGSLSPVAGWVPRLEKPCRHRRHRGTALQAVAPGSACCLRPALGWVHR